MSGPSDPRSYKEYAILNEINNYWRFNGSNEPYIYKVCDVDDITAVYTIIEYY